MFCFINLTESVTFFSDADLRVSWNSSSTEPAKLASFIRSGLNNNAAICNLKSYHYCALYALAAKV